jgi:hypothetical protein
MQCAVIVLFGTMLAGVVALFVAQHLPDRPTTKNNYPDDHLGI